MTCAVVDQDVFRIICIAKDDAIQITIAIKIGQHGLDFVVAAATW